MIAYFLIQLKPVLLGYFDLNWRRLKVKVCAASKSASSPNDVELGSTPSQAPDSQIQASAQTLAPAPQNDNANSTGDQTPVRSPMDEIMIKVDNTLAEFVQGCQHSTTEQLVVLRAFKDRATYRMNEIATR